MNGKEEREKEEAIHWLPMNQKSATDRKSKQRERKKSCPRACFPYPELKMSSSFSCIYRWVKNDWRKNITLYYL